MNHQSLRDHAEQIWKAGVAAVDSKRLIDQAVTASETRLTICGEVIPLSHFAKVIVVGAGKAGAGMAEGLENALAPILDRVHGWVNVPDDCVRSLKRIRLHGARPAGVNEPTTAGVRGTNEILKLLASATTNDICIVLISGGGSALLPAPREGISLSDKLRVTQLMMQSGKPIEEMNCVRKHLSELKGGGLVGKTNAGRLSALIISDVIGDPLDVIASGPTVPDPTTANHAIDILEELAHVVPQSVLTTLNSAQERQPIDFSRVSNHIIGSNRVAIEASAEMARNLGYAVISMGSENRGFASDVGRSLANQLRDIRDNASKGSMPTCVLSGGEPVVELCSSPGKGGRNQEVALAALDVIRDTPGLLLLAGGTDGEDGPTDAAGGVVSAATYEHVIASGSRITEFLASNNAYTLLAATDGLLVTGPTHTNVMDLRVGLVSID